jgi:TolA-binding protein
VRRAALLAALLLTPALAGAAPAASGYLSCRQRAQAPARPAGGSAPERPAAAPVVDPKDLQAFEEAVRRFDEEARAYRGEAQVLVQKQYEERRRILADHYERAIGSLELEERSEREDAIAHFEEFLSRYPDDPYYTPDAMFRLAELHYEKANDDFRLASDTFREEARLALAEGRDPPPEPMKSYAPSIALYQRLITGFPGYRFTHGITYLLAYCLGEMGQVAEAQTAYQTLIERYPDSPFVPEAWVRLGDAAFDENQPASLQKAAQAFSRMYAFPAHPLYARAIYKLGWTYYRMDAYQEAVESFTRLLDHYVALAKGTGQKPSGDVWPEAVQYTAISFADEKWGGVDKARAFFAAAGGRPYEAEVFTRLGDVYFEETKYPQAVEAYQQVLKLQPLSPDAPRLHAKMVLAWSRDRRFDLEAKARQALVAAYSEGTPWWEANKGDPDLVFQVRDLIEKGLLRAAAFHHAQAQQYKAEGKLEPAVAEYRFAAQAYGDYLARFPRSKQAHELAYNYADCLYNALDFDRAARTYAQVRDDPADDKFQAEAALSAVISWEGEVTRLERSGQLPARKVLLSKDRKEKDDLRPVPLPEAYQGLVRDSDAFLARLPDHPKAPTIAYKAGEVFFRYNDFDESRCRLEEVLARWPGSEVGQFAANLVIESHLTAKDWKAVEEASARLQGLEVGKNPGLQSSLQKFKLGGRFNRAMQSMEAKRYEEAAQLFTALVQDDPKHEFADKALFNAASCYEGARRFESALRMYERISAEYPRSTLADEALFRVGFNAENTYDFEKAVGRYQALVDRYPNSKHRKDALYNAARALENLQRYGPAAGAFARYARAYPDAPDAARTQFHAALIYEKTQDWRKEIAALQDFDRRFGASKEHELIVQSHLKIGLASRELKDHRSARAAYAAAVAEFARRGLKPETHLRAAAAAAEARFNLAEYEFEKYDAIALPATTDPKRLKRALDAKFAEAKRVAPLYDEVGKYKRPDWILAAFYRKAFLLERLAQTIYEAPIPAEYKRPGMEEYLAAYQDGLAQFAQPYEEQAVAVYVQAIEAARKLHVKNEWTKKTAESLARYRPREYPVLKEAKSRLATEDRSPVALADTADGPTKRPPPPPPSEAPPPERPAAGGTAQPSSPPPPEAKLGGGDEK